MANIINTNLIKKIMDSVENSISSVYKLDASLAELQRTSSMTASQLESFYRSANKTAKEIGMTTQQVIDQAAAWTRLGYESGTAAIQLAKLSSQLTLLSPGMSSTDAIVGLDSIIKTYGLEITDVLDNVISNIHTLGSTFSLNNTQMISMLKDSVAAMADGNNTLKETIALEAAALQLTGDASAGDCFKTAALRLQGLNEETQIADASLTTIAKDLYNLTGISIMEDADTYKSTYQILREISMVWDSLSANKQAKSLDLIFGSSNSNTGAAILQNFDAVEDAMLQISGSAGNATAALTSSTDTITYKLNGLKETGIDISHNLFQQEEMKTGINLLQKFANVIEFITDKVGLMGTVTLGTGLFTGMKNIGRTKGCLL